MKRSPEEDKYKILCANVRELMKYRGARDLIWHILCLTEIYSNSFTGNSETFYLEGRKSVGLDILQVLEDSDPTIYPRLLLEKLNKEVEENG